MSGESNKLDIALLSDMSDLMVYRIMEWLVWWGDKSNQNIMTHKIISNINDNILII